MGLELWTHLCYDVLVALLSQMLGCCTLIYSMQVSRATFRCCCGIIHAAVATITNAAPNSLSGKMSLASLLQLPTSAAGGGKKWNDNGRHSLMIKTPSEEIVNIFENVLEFRKTFFHTTVIPLKLQWACCSSGISDECTTHREREAEHSLGPSCSSVL